MPLKRTFAGPIAVALLLSACRSVPVPSSDPTPSAPSPVVAADLSITDFAAVPEVLKPGKGPVRYSWTATESGAHVVELWIGSGERVVRSGPIEGVRGRRMSFDWDGLGSEGSAVGDGTVFPVVVVGDGDRARRWDPRRGAATRPEIVRDAEINVVDGTIAYDLSAASLVLIRAGSPGGAVYRHVVDWEARPEGPNVDRWDGRDPSGRVSFIGDPEMGVATLAVPLPAGSVILEGRRGSADRRIPAVPSGSVPGFWGRTLDGLRSPDVRFELTTPPPAAEGGWVGFRVSARDGTSLSFQTEPFEIGLFLDGNLVQEEPRGVLPYEGRLHLQGPAPGRRILTVNVSNFSNQHGTSSLELEIR